MKSEDNKKEGNILDLEKKRIEKKIENQVDEKSRDALKDMIHRFTDDTLTGK